MNLNEAWEEEETEVEDVVCEEAVVKAGGDVFALSGVVEDELHEDEHSYFVDVEQQVGPAVAEALLQISHLANLLDDVGGVHGEDGVERPVQPWSGAALSELSSVVGVNSHTDGEEEWAEVDFAESPLVLLFVILHALSILFSHTSQSVVLNSLVGGWHAFLNIALKWNYILTINPQLITQIIIS